jgi:hypothetical protein
VVSTKAQITPRNIFGKDYSLGAVQQSLIPLNQWHPYPQNPPNGRLKCLIRYYKKLLKTEKKLSIINLSLFQQRFHSIMFALATVIVMEIFFGKRNNLFQLLLAESIEDKGRFMEAILNGIWSICEESYWGVPAHIGHTGLPDVTNPVVDLFSAETASVLAIADYWVGKKLDKINPLIRKRIYHETNVRIFNPMLNNPERFGWMSKTKPVNNWNPWIMSNWIMSNLL